MWNVASLKMGQIIKCLGFILNFHQLNSLDSIKEEWGNRNIEFSRVERIMIGRAGQKEPTTAVLVEFLNLGELPKSIVIDFGKYDIKKYERDPIRRYK